MAETIKVPATHKGTLEITGTMCGQFLVHKNITTLELDFDQFPCWSVTHVKTGMRFPWVFMTEEAAIAFSEDVTPVMAWDKIAPEMAADNSATATWGKNEPTKEEKQAVGALAKKRGAFKAAVRTANALAG